MKLNRLNKKKDAKERELIRCAQIEEKHHALEQDRRNHIAEKNRQVEEKEKERLLRVEARTAAERDGKARRRQHSAEMRKQAAARILEQERDRRAKLEQKLTAAEKRLEDFRMSLSLAHKPDPQKEEKKRRALHRSRQLQQERLFAIQQQSQQKESRRAETAAKRNQERVQGVLHHRFEAEDKHHALCRRQRLSIFGHAVAVSKIIEKEERIDFLLTHRHLQPAGNNFSVY